LSKNREPPLTAALIDESQRNAVDGEAVSAEVGDVLEQIVSKVQKGAQLISEVALASDEQAKAITQINIAVTEMDKVTQSNAANAEQSASASEQLSAQASEMSEMVDTLVSIVRGTAGTGQETDSMQPSMQPAKSGRELQGSDRMGGTRIHHDGGLSAYRVLPAPERERLKPQQAVLLEDEALF
jgi:methyl-accepting chemotaxis protein